jgi:hypothetical protein
MDAQDRRDWLQEGQRHDMTCVCETALHAAAGITWQRLGWIAAGGTSTIGQDYLDPTRTIIAEYLRHTGRLDEAIEVLAVGCNEPPPPTMFGNVDPAKAAELRDVLRGL